MDERPTTEDEPGYGIGAVARRLGVPAPTLRTWNLRYGLGPSRRSPGGHRRYDSRDLRRLEEMNRLIRSGVPAADAAKLVMGPGFTEEIATAPRPAPAPGRSAAGNGTPPPQPPAGPGPHAPSGTSPGTAAGSPEVPPEIPSEIPTVAMLTRAAVALDSGTVSGWIGAALARYGVQWTWEHLVLPVFASISRRQAETGAAIEIEHVFSDRVLAALIPLVRPPQVPVNDRPVLLACAEDEQHSLAVYALAAALTTGQRVETRVLGARTPFSALAEAMRRVGPSVVFVWSQQSATGDPGPLTRLPVSRPPSRIVAGGPGWWPEDLPPSIPHVTSFRDALVGISAALS
ncbi:MerR family transcriptional regulator [Planobispora takensis]|uniref:MerR family transcriptional regulator n=1 Tax=Planobispora takensis TaxID=1367882 RepID=A0A8J3WVX1_9ACTN|nr:MerR family transcriptional regulator [Planobispora takensis]GII01327.1 MerR family transcriptional regulator [Planobispora takensis]